MQSIKKLPKPVTVGALATLALALEIAGFALLSQLKKNEHDPAHPEDDQPHMVVFGLITGTVAFVILGAAAAASALKVYSTKEKIGETAPLLPTHNSSGAEQPTAAVSVSPEHATQGSGDDNYIPNATL